MIPEKFRANPRAYDLWQAYTFLAAQSDEADAAGEAEFEWRFGFPARLSFPGTEVEGFDTEAMRLDVNLPDSPLPLSLVETIIQERHEGNRSLQDFLDLLQNRLMRLWMEDAETMCPELGRIKDEDDFSTGEGPHPPVAEWLDMPENFRTRLARVNSQLGTDAILGKTVFDSCNGIAYITKSAMPWKG